MSNIRDNKSNSLFFYYNEEEMNFKLSSTNDLYVAIFANQRSDKVVKKIRLSAFSQNFIEMALSGFLEKVFYDNDKITAVSEQGTYFVPKIRY
jgi:hypothetical protein